MPYGLAHRATPEFPSICIPSSPLPSSSSQLLNKMSVPAQTKTLFLESKFGQFAVRPAETPRPGSGEVLVKVEATALNPLDWKVQALGLFIENYPAVLGFDAAGTIAQIGEDVPASSFAVGDRVYVAFAVSFVLVLCSQYLLIQYRPRLVRCYQEDHSRHLHGILRAPLQVCGQGMSCICSPIWASR